MADLHDALKSLSPIQWADVPLDNLPEFLQDTFAASELICNSVPQPLNGTPFQASKPHHKKPNSARSAKDMHASATRAQQTCQAHEDLQKHWGKPYKIKDNPLEVQIYKMAGSDRHGAWFARRSVHEGLGFARFKSAMQREFPHSMAVEGGPGAGAVRGIGVDRRLEEREVDRVGKLEVYELSAQFPGPVTPRDFETLLLTTDDALSEKSEAKAEEGGHRHAPRHFMIVSKPVEHPDAPLRAGYVRGQYESVELVREIPLQQALSKSTPNLLSTQAGSERIGRDRGSTIAFAESRGPEAKGEQRDLYSQERDGTDDPELNPVEWIMITRSDPGGGIPRFLVDRGTPDAMIADISKFLNWACALSETSDTEPPASEVNNAVSIGNGVSSTSTSDQQGVTSVPHRNTLQRSVTTPMPSQGQGGLFAGAIRALGAGVDTYAPTSVARGYRDYIDPATDDSDTSSDASSVRSFMSAEEMRRLSMAPAERPSQSVDNLSVVSSTSIASGGHKKNLSQSEKEVQKLLQEREKLDRKLAKKRADEEARFKKSQEKDETGEAKARERMEREVKKTEEKHKRELEKLEQKREREMQNAEERRRKRDDQSKLSLVSRERDDFRSQAELLRRESGLLHKQVEDLQRENTLLAAKLGKIGGPDSLKAVQDELKLGRQRASSARSKGSEKSGESKT